MTETTKHPGQTVVEPVESEPAPYVPQVGDRVRVKALAVRCGARRQDGLIGFSIHSSKKIGTIYGFERGNRPKVSFVDGDCDYGHASELELIEPTGPTNKEQIAQVTRERDEARSRANQADEDAARAITRANDAEAKLAKILSDLKESAENDTGEAQDITKTNLARWFGLMRGWVKVEGDAS